MTSSSHWLDDELTAKVRIEKDGVVYPTRSRISIGSGLTVTDDPSNDQIIIAAAAVESGPAAARVVAADDDDLDFAGTPGFADVDIFPQTIVTAEVNDTVSWDFFSNGVEAGWVVWFAITGSGGIVRIRDATSGDAVRLVMSTEETASVRGIYFDGTNWLALVAGAGGQGELILPTWIVTGGVTTYTVDSRTQKDVVILVDTSTVAVTVNMPVHRLGRFLAVKNWKGTGGTHGITLHRASGTGKFNSVPADLSLGGSRDFTVLLSDGIDNWEDLVITGT